MRAFSRWALATLVAALVVFSVLLLADTANASPQCGASDQVLTLLKDRYGEAMVGEGGAGGGSRLLIYAHPDGDTWSVVVLLPDGRACLMASGADWTNTPPGSET